MLVCSVMIQSLEKQCLKRVQNQKTKSFEVYTKLISHKEQVSSFANRQIILSAYICKSQKKKKQQSTIKILLVRCF